MTDYVNNRFIKQTAEWLQEAPWFKGQVMGKAGTMPAPALSNNEHYIQFDKLYALGANIKKSDMKAYPESVITAMKSLLRKAKWFNGLMEWTDAEHEDYVNGNSYEVENTRRKIDNINFQYDYDLEKWFVGYGSTFTSDVDYDERWIPWMCLKTTASSTPSDPGDMNDKVTNIAGTTGTTATELDMTTVLTSTSTNMTMDFARQTFGPIIRAFNKFEDSNNGRRMVDYQSAFNIPRYQCHVHPDVVPELNSAPVYDGEKILPNYSVADAMAKMGIEIIPNRQFSAALAEEAGGAEGKIQFGFTANFSQNFKIGFVQKMKWEADLEIPGRNSKWIKKMNSRLVPYTEPYYDGSKWYKAFFAGYFTFRNDT